MEYDIKEYCEIGNIDFFPNPFLKLLEILLLSDPNYLHIQNAIFHQIQSDNKVYYFEKRQNQILI
jgi:hypothetical protein